MSYEDEQEPEFEATLNDIDAEIEYDDPAADPLHRSQMSGMSEETSSSVAAEMARREAAGLSAVPEMSWED